MDNINIQTEEELKAMIWERYGSFELSHIKNESIVESIFNFVLKQRSNYAKFHLQAQQEAILKNVKYEFIPENQNSFGKVFIDKDSIINAYNINSIK